MKVLPIMVTGLALAGCGGTEELTGDEQLQVSQARVTMAHLVRDGSNYGQALDDMDRMIALYREKPEAEYDGQSMRQMLEDMASDLEPYRPRMAAEIDRALGR